MAQARRFRIQFASDLHLEWLRERFPDERLVVPAPDADLLVLAGDIDNGLATIVDYADWPIPVVQLAGNHEYYGEEFESTRSALVVAAGRAGLHWLDDSRIEFDGLRILGATLWTDYRLHGEAERDWAMAAAATSITDHRLIRLGDRRFLPQDAAALHERSREWLAAELGRPFDGLTVVVSHHAPHPKSTAGRFRENPLNPAFISDLEGLIGQADLWIHGHVHDSFDYRVGRCRVVANPRGYPLNLRAASSAADLVFENPKFDPAAVVELALPGPAAPR